MVTSIRSITVIQVLLASSLLVKCGAQYYQVQDNEEYSPIRRQSSSANAQTESEGFVKPIDFTNLFAAATEDLRNDQSIPRDFFQSTSSSVNPFSLPLQSATNSFPSDVELIPNAHNNSAGFTNPEVKFQSLFDISGSASEVGFRPQDFLKHQTNNEENGSASPSVEFESFVPNFGARGSYSPQSQAAPTYPDGTSSPKSALTTENHNQKLNYKVQSPEKYLSSSSKQKPEKSDYYYNPEKYSYPASATSYVNSLHSTDKNDKKHLPAPSSDHYSGKLSYTPAIQGSTKAPYQASSYNPTSSSTYKAAPSAVRQDNLYPVNYYTGTNEYNLPLNSYKDNPAPQLAAAPSYAPATSNNFNQYSNPQTLKSAYEQTSSTITPYNAPKTPDLYNIYSASVNPTSNVSPASKYGSSYTVAKDEPYVKQASEGVRKSSDGANDKKCKKIDKHLTSDDIINGRFKRDAMTCYLCEDPKTKTNYEKCSYETEPQATNYFKGHTQSYKIDHAHAPQGFRFRRDIHDYDFDFGKDYKRNINTFYPRKVRQQSDTSYGYPSGYTGSDYQYGPNYFKEFEEIEKQSAASSVIPDEKNCKKVQKESMTCYECINPKTGGNYEQCSYTSDPKKSNYFVAHQTSYNSANNKQKEPSRYRRDEEDKLSNHGDKQSQAASKKEENKSYEFPTLYSSSTENKDSKKSAGVGLDPFLYGKPDSYVYNSDKKADSSDNSDSYYYPSKSYDEYFRHLFPELDEINKASASSESEKYEKDSGSSYYSPQVNEEKSQPSYETKSDYYPSQPSEAKNVPNFEIKSAIPSTFFTNNEEKKDLHKVLGEFSKKDWSDCKKVFKDKMTCYQCTDKKGLQHEECMFVAASEPKSEHLAYHEVKEFRLVPTGKENQTAAESKVSEILSSPNSTELDKLVAAPSKKNKRKTFFKKVSSTASPSADNKFLDSQKVEIVKEKVQANKRAPGVAVRVTRRSSQSISTTKTTMLTTPEPLPSEEKKTKITKRRVPKSDMLQSASEVNEKHDESPPRKTKSSSAPLTSEPELSEHDRSPDGYYSSETRVRFDPILQVTLPEYMLTRSEHEAIFDEVMASGR